MNLLYIAAISPEKELSSKKPSLSPSQIPEQIADINRMNTIKKPTKDSFSHLSSMTLPQNDQSSLSPDSDQQQSKSNAKLFLSTAAGDKRFSLKGEGPARLPTLALLANKHRPTIIIQEETTGGKENDFLKILQTLHRQQSLIKAGEIQSQRTQSKISTRQIKKTQSQDQIFVPQSFTQYDNFMSRLVNNRNLQYKLKKMQTAYSESQMFPPAYNFKKEELQKMTKMEILSQLAKSESMPNLVHIANNSDKKIPITSLKISFGTKQQYFTFDDPKEKEQIMNLYNMRARIKEQAKVSKKQCSLSSHYLSLIKQKQQQLPKVDDYYMFSKQKTVQNTNKAVIDMKISQKEADIPRNLVTNSILSLQRKEFMEKTLHVKKNIKNELKENAEKMQRRLDQFYFEEPDAQVISPISKMTKAATKFLKKQGTQTPQQRVAKIFAHLKKKQEDAKKNDLEKMMDQMSPQQDSFLGLEKEEPGIEKLGSKKDSIVDLLDQNKDLNKIAAKYFNTDIDQIDDNSQLYESNDSSIIEENTGKKHDQKSRVHSHANSFIQKLKKVNKQFVNTVEQKHFQLSQYKQEQRELQEMKHEIIEEDSIEDFAKQRVKPKQERQSGLIVKDKALPQHKLMIRKGLSIMKYNYQD